MTTANDFLMSGGGAKSAKFPTVGTTVAGAIVGEPELQQQRDMDGTPKFWESDGKPMMQLRVIVSTAERDPADPEDNGDRAIYIKAKLQEAVRDAVRAARAPGLAPGGILSVTYTSNGTPSKPGLTPPKLYSATYTPPAAAAANEFISAGQGAPAAAPMNQAQLAAAARANQTPPPAPAAAPAPAGVSPEALAAIAALTPEQKAALNL